MAYADDARELSVAWAAHDTPPIWLQSGLTRVLVAIAEGRAPDPSTAPPAPSDDADSSGDYMVPGIGKVPVVCGGPRLQVVVREVTDDAFEVAPGVHYVPGVDAGVRLHAQPDGQPTLSWDSVLVVAPSVPRRGQAP